MKLAMMQFVFTNNYRKLILMKHLIDSVLYELYL